MGLSKYKLGDLISLAEEKNTDLRYEVSAVKGVSIRKVFIETKANMTGVSLRPYLIVKPDYFAYVPVTSRNGDKITIAHNDTQDTYIVSSSYVVFYVSKPDILDSNYLFMFFNRKEFDRYTRFNSWGSARETFSWDEMCNIEIELPDISIQRKYVDIYRGMQENLDAMNKSVEQSVRAYEILLDKSVHSSEQHPIGELIEETDIRNTELLFGKSDVKGMTITKEIIPTKANTTKAELDSYKIVYPNEFVYNPRTHGKKIGLGFNQSTKPFIISWNNASFKVRKEKADEIIAEYLYLCFCRSEWDREACFQSWGSSTEVFSWNALCKIKIGVPEITEQESIVEIYNAVRKRRNQIDKLAAMQKDICPVLIRGAIAEGGRS